jgi:hypothetical protein
MIKRIMKSKMKKRMMTTVTKTQMDKTSKKMASTTIPLESKAYL